VEDFVDFLSARAKKRQVERLFDTMDQLARLEPPLTEAEIDAEIAAARAGRITLFTSPVLLAELEDVLSREKFAERVVRVGSSVAQMLAGYRALVTIVRPAAIEPTVRDPDDGHVLACAKVCELQHKRACPTA
jgi:PIN domain